METADLIVKEGLRHGFSPRTINSYCFCVARFLKWAKKDIKLITKKDVREYIDFLLEKGDCGNTVNVYLNALKFFFEEILERSFLLKVRYSKVPKTLPVVLSKEETKHLIAAITNKKHNLMISLMYSAGLRVSELLNLRLKDLELDKNIGWVRKGKGGKDRLFVVAERLKETISAYIQEYNINYEGWLFQGNKGFHLSIRTVQEIIKRAANRAGIKKHAHPHTLRHSFGTHLIEDGYDVTTVQSLLGHSSIETTMIYVHVASPKMINVRSPYDSL